MSPEAPSTQIRLRPVEEADLPIFYEQQLDPMATEMAAFPSREREPFMAHWKKIMADPAMLQRTILFGDEVAGNVVSWVQDGEREVGYWLGRAYWGKGLATEALKQLLAEIKARPVFGYVARRNVASRRVLEKCGFKLERESEEEYVLVLDH